MGQHYSYLAREPDNESLHAVIHIQDTTIVALDVIIPDAAALGWAQVGAVLGGISCDERYASVLSTGQGHTLKNLLAHSEIQGEKEHTSLRKVLFGRSLS